MRFGLRNTRESKVTIFTPTVDSAPTVASSFLLCVRVQATSRLLLWGFSHPRRAIGFYSFAIFIPMAFRVNASVLSAIVSMGCLRSVEADLFLLSSVAKGIAEILAARERLLFKIGGLSK